MSVNSHSTRSAEPRKRPRQQRSREMVTRILDTAARIFEAEGYQATTTNHVAETAGVSVGSLYQYFPNKDALLVGLAERHLDEVGPHLTALAARLEAEAPPVVPLCRAFVEEVVALNRSDRLHRLLWQAPRTAELAERLEAVELAMTGAVEGHLRRFGHPPDLAPVRARLLVTMVEAAAHDLGPRRDGVDPAEELVEMVVAVVEAGAR